MTKKLIVAIALSAITVSACGSKNSYKAALITHKAAQPDPASLNDVAEETIEAQAEKALLADQHHMMYRMSTLSGLMKEEILGTSGQVSVAGELSKIEVSLLDSRSSDCKEKSNHVEVASLKRNETNRINNLARVRCVDTSCDHLLVFIETRRNVENQEFGTHSILNGTVAVLLKKDQSGSHKPLTTESKNFLQLNSTDVAVQTCVEVAGLAQKTSTIAAPNKPAPVVPAPTVPEPQKESVDPTLED